MTPGFDFYIFTLISAVILGAGILLDSPGLYLLAVLLLPFLGPVYAISFNIAIGSGKFFLRELASLAISVAILFGVSLVTGLVGRLLPADLGYSQAGLHAVFAWPDFLVLAVGSGLATYMLIRSPRQKPLVANVALGYGLYLPLAVAAFGLTSGVPGLWIDGLLVFLIHLAWSALVGVVVLLLMGVRPVNLFGYTLTGAIVLIGIAAAIVITSLYSPAPVEVTVIAEDTATPTLAATSTRAQQAVDTPQPTASLTPAPVASLTPSLIPSNTPTLTVTPEPTPVWAQINSPTGNGAVVRNEPDGSILTSLLNGNMVQVISAPVTGQGSVIWVQVRTESGLEGWMVQSLLATATPSPQW